MLKRKGVICDGWRPFRMHGTGEYTFSTGTRYLGQWKHGTFHGKGVMHFPSGTKYEATWDNGKVVEVRKIC